MFENESYFWHGCPQSHASLRKADPLQHRNVIVIGGSAGSLEPLRTIVSRVPPDFAASIFVVLHISAESPALLDEQISGWGSLPATFPADREQILPGHIYVARPDCHLTLEPGRMRVLRGPRENRHRPAIDPLFRTAARLYGPRVIGIVLSGLNDDGSAGLYAIKQRGGVAIVQDPQDALYAEMPSRALRYSSPHYVLGAWDIPPTLIRLVNADQDVTVIPQKNDTKSSRHANSPETKNSPSGDEEQNLKVAYSDEGEGIPSVFACPECHGVLWEVQDKDKDQDKDNAKDLVRFRCRVGHSYGSESLTQELSQASETALWAAMRALEEKSAMHRRAADYLASDPKSAERLRDQSSADEANARHIRDMIFSQDAVLLELEARRTHPGSTEENEEKSA